MKQWNVPHDDPVQGLTSIWFDRESAEKLMHAINEAMGKPKVIYD